MTKEAPLPDRCVKCNTHTDGRLKRTVTWHHPAVYLLLLPSILIYAIVAGVIRKTAIVHVGFCPKHFAARRMHRVITVALLLSSVVSFLVAVELADFTYALLAVVLILTGAVYGILSLRVVVATKIDDQVIWLKGVSADYLQEFPEWGGAR